MSVYQKFSTISELIQDLKNGKFVLLVDAEDRENEGDLILAADFISPEKVNFMAREACGLICLAMAPAQVDQLKLPLMVSEENNQTPNKTAFTVSIEAATGISTGISAADRSLTIFKASRPNAKPADVIVPGHIFPLRGHPQGVLGRAGHTEASIDLMTLSGLNPCAVICEVVNVDGTMAKGQQLFEFAEKHQIRIGTIDSLVQYLKNR